MLAHKFELNDDIDQFLASFVKNGYLVFSNVFDNNLIDECRIYFEDKYNELLKAHNKNLIPLDIQGWGNAILDKFSTTKLYDQLMYSNRLHYILEKIIGPDIAVLNYDHLWINSPSNKDPVLKKDIHTDTWTGTSVDTIISNIYFTDADEYNGLTVFPGTHLHGMTPVLNRKPDPRTNINYEPYNLNLKMVQ